MLASMLFQNQAINLPLPQRFGCFDENFATTVRAAGTERQTGISARARNLDAAHRRAGGDRFSKHLRRFFIGLQSFHGKYYSKLFAFEGSRHMPPMPKAFVTLAGKSVDR